MRREIYVRVIEAANCIVREGLTVRACARWFGIGKTTIHKDMRERLPEIDPALASRVDAVLRQNRSERHLRGGAATKALYLRQKKRDAGASAPSAGQAERAGKHPRPGGCRTGARLTPGAGRPCPALD